MAHRWIPVLVLAVILAACARPAATDSEEPPVEVELVIGLSSQGLRPAVDDVIRSFEAKNPGVTVRVVEWQGPFYDFTRAVTESEIQEHFDGMDLVISMYLLTGRPLHDHGYLRDLSAFTMPEPDPLVADYMAGLGEIDGQRTFVPLVRSPHMFMFNEDVFEQRSLAIPGPEWTYAELQAVLRELKHEGLLARTRVSPSMLLSSVVTAYGGQFYNFTTERWEMNTPENRAALGVLAQLAAEELMVLPQALYTYVEHPEAAVMHIGSRRLSGYRPVPYPAGPVRRVTGAGEATDAMVLSTTEHPEMAMAFLAELLSPEVGAMALARAGFRPLVYAPEAVALWREQVGSDWAEPFEVGLAGLQPEISDGPQAGFSINMELLQAIELGASIPEVLADLEGRLNQEH